MAGMSRRLLTYSQDFVYAVAKRQLGRREVRARLGNSSGC
jgi:hypothetical protein